MSDFCPRLSAWCANATDAKSMFFTPHVLWQLKTRLFASITTGFERQPIDVFVERIENARDLVSVIGDALWFPASRKHVDAARRELAFAAYNDEAAS